MKLFEQNLRESAASGKFGGMIGHPAPSSSIQSGEGRRLEGDRRSDSHSRLSCEKKSDNLDRKSDIQEQFPLRKGSINNNEEFERSRSEQYKQSELKKQQTKERKLLY